MANASKIAAFFDVDDTIVVGTNTLLLYVRHLVKKGLMSRWQLMRGIYLSLLHKIGWVDIEKVLDDFSRPYAGRADVELKQTTQEWFDASVIPHISPEAVQKIEEHRKQNHVVSLLSTSTQYVCEPMQAYLKVDKTINSVANVQDGILTGTLQKPLCHGEGKVRYAKEFAKQNDIDLSQSYFYTDSHSDLPMMEIVGHPVAVNPDPLLARHAKAKNWPIVHWHTKIGTQS